MKNCKLANSRYNAALEEMKNQVEKDETSRKRQLMDEEIVIVKKKKDDMTKCIKVLKTNADKLSIEAEKKQDFKERT